MENRREENSVRVLVEGKIPGAVSRKVGEALRERRAARQIRATRAVSCSLKVHTPMHRAHTFTHIHTQEGQREPHICSDLALFLARSNPTSDILH